jgi:plasmid stabilization system protein ParE
MAVEINWTPPALQDVESIAEFIARDSEHFARIQTTRFLKRVEMLKEFPHAGRVVPEFSNETLRELIEGNYRIVYRIVDETRVDILTIHNSYRLLSNNPLFKE